MPRDLCSAAPYRLLTAVAFIGASLGGSGLAAADRITAVKVEANSKTTDATVKLIAGISVGDDWQPTLIEQIRDRLEQSGLFREHSVYWETGPDGVVVHLVARDKHSWVIAPTVYNQPTNKGGGLGFGENNLFGENKKLLLYGQVATGDSFFVGAYVDPSIAGTRWHWQVDTFLKSGRVIEYAAPTAWRDDPQPVRESRLRYLNGGLRVGLDIWKLSLDSRIRGAHVAYSKVRLAEGATLEDVTGMPGPPDPPPPGSVQAPGSEGWDLSNQWSLTYDSRANYDGISVGSRVFASFERSLPRLGSDFDYTLLFFRAERGVRVLARHNLVVKTQLNAGRNVPFQQEYLTGGTQMRGFVNGQLRGDLQLAANTEYSVPLFAIKGVSMRGMAFWDSAYTTFLDGEDRADRDHLPGAEARGAKPFKNSVGAGVRMYMKQIVLPLLGLDVGYGLERGTWEVYLAIGLTD